ncbi:MAG: hypothetical protein MUC81_04150 [Bacteroidia bacterium]|jgi:hypothetical protein|nr:hypothetical protein [Bacteroidia bacterium]
MKRLFIIGVMLFMALPSFSQVATLYAGLNEVVGTRGNIDVELLSEIIVDKQQQLKKEFARKTLLRNIENGSYTFYSFADNTFDLLFNTTNKKAATRKLIETSANFAIAYGFTEFYLQASRRLLRNGTLAGVISNADFLLLSPEEQKRWLIYLSAGSADCGNEANIYTVDALRSLVKSLMPKSNSSALNQIACYLNNDKVYSAILENGYTGLFDSIFTLYNREYPGFNSNTYLLDKLKPNDSLRNTDSAYQLNFILVDMVYDVLLNSEQVNKLGFFVSENSVSDKFYKEHNAYYNFIYNQRCQSRYPVLIDSLKQLYNRISGEINLLFETYTTLNDTAQKELSIIEMSKLNQPFRDSVAFARSLNRILNLQDSLAVFTLKTSYQINVDSVAKEVNALFQKLNTLFIKANGVLHNTIRDDEYLYTNNDLLFITRTAFPILTKLSMFVKIPKESFATMDTIYRYLLFQQVQRIYIQTAKFSPALLYKKVDIFNDFVELLTNLNDLDKAASYATILKVIQNAGAMYLSSNTTSMFNVLVNNIEKYAVIDTKENKISIDVESIILAVYKQFANKEKSIFDFYFSVGLNQSVHLGDDFKFIASDSLQNFSFAAEKIGVKMKLVNIKKYRQYNVGEYAPSLFGKEKLVDRVRSKNPYISDVHLIVFGSGLLYNIVNTKTSSSFKSYLLGCGAGVSFFNGLDFNLSYNFPIGGNNSFTDVINPSNSFSMLTFSLDIKIGEYLAAIANKKSIKKQ